VFFWRNSPFSESLGQANSTAAPGEYAATVVIYLDFKLTQSLELDCQGVIKFTGGEFD
jgi:hypothetical protein